MNEVKKCSIANIAFTLDIDAYEELECYLTSLEQAYSNTPDGAEIIADLEARIAELILSAQDSSKIVEKPLILNIIRQLGTAQDLSEEENESKQTNGRFPQRLYRDLDHARLGGVCAGLGRYFRIDPVWIRLGIFLPLLLNILFTYMPGGWWFSGLCSSLFKLCIMGYVIMWFAVPAARSARQRLEMEGEPITARSVANATTERKDPDGEAKLVMAQTVSAFSTVVLILLKILAGIFVFGLLISACVGILGVLTLSFSSLGIPTTISTLLVTALICILIPIFLMIYVLMCLIASHKPSGKWIGGIFGVWILTILVLLALGIRTAYQEGFNEWNLRTWLSGWSTPTHIPLPKAEDLEEQLDALDSDLNEVDRAIENLRWEDYSSEESL